jgi:hypothetical protein
MMGMDLLDWLLLGTGLMMLGLATSIVLYHYE